MDISTLCAVIGDWQTAPDSDAYHSLPMITRHTKTNNPGTNKSHVATNLVLYTLRLSEVHALVVIHTHYNV